MGTFDAAVALTVIAALLLAVAVGQPVAARFRLPSSVLLAAIGVVIGFAALAFPHAGVDFPGGQPLASGTLIYIFLPLLVFEAGFAADMRRTIEDAAPILLLAIVATIITTAAIGLSLWPFASVPLVACLLTGAVVATTDPAAVIAIFRDVGAPARLIRLVEGESLLNDAAAIALFAVLLSTILSGRDPNIAAGALEFATSFAGGAIAGVIAGRVLVFVMSRLGDDRLAESSATVAGAYLTFIGAERMLHVSGVVAVLCAGLTCSAMGRSRAAPSNWTFLRALWEQIAFWARSLVFVLAAILVPRLLRDVSLHDLFLLGVLTFAAFGSRAFSVFVLVPALERFGLSQPINRPYKLAILWGGLRGALTLLLALAVTENAALAPDVRRFVAVLGTGFVLFTLFVNGTTLRLIIHSLGLDRLSPRDLALRDRVLTLSSAAVTPDAVAALKPAIADRDELPMALIAVGNHERVLVLETLAVRSASPAVVRAVLDHTDGMVEGARRAGRDGYERAADAALGFPLSFRFAYAMQRRLGLRCFLRDQLAERIETLLVVATGLDRLAIFNEDLIRYVFGERVAASVADIIGQRQRATVDSLEALRLQYPEFCAQLEAMLLRKLEMRRELLRFSDLLDEGIIESEVYENLKRTVSDAGQAMTHPRLDLGLETRRLLDRLDIFASLDEAERRGVARLLRPRFAIPGEKVIKRNFSGDAMYFIASGAVEVVLPTDRVRLGTGDFFGEMALLSGALRTADVVALTYCRLLMLRKVDFDRFLAANPGARQSIESAAAARRAAQARSTTDS